MGKKKKMKRFGKTLKKAFEPVISKEWKSKKQPVSTEEIQVVIPSRIYRLLRYLSSKFTTEFSIYSRIEQQIGGAFFIADDFVIPEQEVTGSFVEVLTPVPNYNVFFHKHPSGVTSFSYTDAKYCNSNNALSLLWCDNAFVDGTVNLPLAGGNRLQVQIAAHQIREQRISIPNEFRELDISMIKEKKWDYKNTYQGYNNNNFYDQPKKKWNFELQKWEYENDTTLDDFYTYGSDFDFEKFIPKGDLDGKN